MTHAPAHLAASHDSDPQVTPRSRVLAAINDHARRRPFHPAIITPSGTARPETRVSYGDLQRAILGASSELAQRTVAGDRVVLACTNGADYACCFLGALHAGLEVLPVPVNAGAAEVVRMCNAAKASLIVTTSDGTLAGATVPIVGTAALLGTPGLQTGAAPRPGRVLLQSSGTTGLPKVVRRTSDALDAVSIAVAEATGLNESDTVLAAIPMSHSYGMENGLLAPLRAGATIVALPELTPGSVEVAIALGVTVLPGVPFLFETLAAAPPSHPHRPRLVYSAGATLPRSVADRFERTWGMRVGQLYGATEIGSVTFESPTEPSFDVGRVGRPMREVSIIVCDPERLDHATPLTAGAEGHILIRSASMLDSYLDGPVPLLKGHFPTGDLGTLDRDGRLTITGRLKLMIDVGGVKVNPLEVERTLCEHPAVAECVVVALPITAAVSRLRAVIVPRRGHAAPDAGDLRAFARDRLATYKVPRVFEFRPSLPKSPTGKVLRRVIEEGA